MFDHSVGEWVSARLPEPVEWGDPDLWAAIGLMEDGKPIAGVVYTACLVGPAGPHSMSMHIAAVRPRWAHRRTLEVFFAFPFAVKRVARVTAVIRPDGCANMLERLGFRHEGTMRRGYPSGADALIYGMLREECRWI